MLGWENLFKSLFVTPKCVASVCEPLDVAGCHYVYSNKLTVVLSSIND